MPIQSWLHVDSGASSEGETPSSEQVWRISGTGSRIAAKAELERVTPIVDDGLLRQSWRVEPDGDDLWWGYVTYGERRPLETGDSSYQFETAGGTQHIVSSLLTRSKYPAPGRTVPESYNLIGVTKDAVEGTDITLRVFNWSETHILPALSVTQAYIDTLFRLTGTVNATPWRARAGGEVLFRGCAGGIRGRDDWEITYHFGASPNVTGLAIGPITGINKFGWDYLWVRYEETEDTTAHALVKQPVAVYVEQVYPGSNFLTLGIGS